jgi:hypothetical protein
MHHTLHLDDIEKLSVKLRLKIFYHRDLQIN